MPLQSATSSGFIVILVLTVMATLSSFLGIIFNRDSFHRLTFKFVLGTFVAQGILLGIHFYGLGYPYLRSFFETMQLTALCILGGYGFLHLRYGFYLAGAVLLPIALIINILSLTHIVARSDPGHFLQNPWAFVHLVFIFIGVAIFTVSFAIGFLYLVQESRIKHKKIGGLLDRIPSLEDMELIHYRSLYAGFIFFTVGVITGGGWSKSIAGVYVTGELKQLLSFAIWIFFALFLNLRVSRGWVGRKGILLSSIGFFGIVFLMVWVQR